MPLATSSSFSGRITLLPPIVLFFSCFIIFFLLPPPLVPAAAVLVSAGGSPTAETARNERERYNFHTRRSPMRVVSNNNGNNNDRRDIGGEILAVYSPARKAVIYNSTNMKDWERCYSAKPCRPGLILGVWGTQEVVGGRFYLFFTSNSTQV
jgi:hypothetical protein